MKIRIRRIGRILEDGVVEGYIPALISSGNLERIYQQIAEVGNIKHSKLLQKNWRHIKAEELKIIIGNLLARGLINAETVGSRRRKIYTIAEGKDLGGNDSNLAKQGIFPLVLNDQLLSEQNRSPLKVQDDIWTYRNNVVHVHCDQYYSEDEIILAVKRYILEEEQKLGKLEKEVSLREELEKGSVRSRSRIRQEVRDLVWRRDEGRCVECGSKELLEFDHIIPVSKGGSNTLRNIQLLCENCNREKRDKI